MNDVLTPELRQVFNQRSNVRGALEVLRDWGLLLVGVFVPVVWSHPVAYGISLALFAAAMAGFAILQHEAAHRSLFETPRLNEVVGHYFAALPLLQSMPGYRRYHMQHHRLAGTPQDPDRIMTDQYPVSAQRLRRKLLRDLSGLTGVKSLVGLLLMMFGRIEYELTGRVTRIEPARSWRASLAYAWQQGAWAALGWQLALVGAAVALQVPGVIAAWWGAFLFVLPVCMRLRQIADHAVVADGDSPNPLMHARSSDARWYERLWLAPHHEHFHLEHHLMPTAPCWQLPKLHAHLQALGVIPEPNQAPSLLAAVRQAVRPSAS